MTCKQKRDVARFLIEKNIEYLVHGDCVGADAEAHAIALSLGITVRKRPSNIKGLQANTVGGLTIAEPENPLVRNRLIVDSCDFLIACPDKPEHTRSGTWSTVRYAKTKDRIVVLYMKD